MYKWAPSIQKKSSILIKNTITLCRRIESRDNSLRVPLWITKPKLDFKVFRDGNPSGFGSMEFERYFHILVLIDAEKNIKISKDYTSFATTSPNDQLWMVRKTNGGLICLMWVHNFINHKLWQKWHNSLCYWHLSTCCLQNAKSIDAANFLEIHCLRDTTQSPVLLSYYLAPLRKIKSTILYIR